MAQLLQSYGDSYIGRRENNEDSLGKREPADPAVLAARGCLYLVSDGMGGHRAGEIASRMAIETILAEYYAASADPASSLVTAIQAANHKIYNAAGDSLATEGMGCTVVACAIMNGSAYVAHVGDSRAYLWRNRQLQQLTQDHSIAAESGSQESGRESPKHVLSRAVGIALRVEATVSEVPAQPNDCFLLCTDGLTNSVPLDEISNALNSNSPREIVGELLRQAELHRAKDNSSAIAIFLNHSGD